MKHELKIWPQYFCRVADGSKTFEVRKNDRGFQPGDEVVLKEYDPTVETWENNHNLESWTESRVRGYSGQSLIFKIGYVFPIDAERVVFSLLPTNNTARPSAEPREFCIAIPNYTGGLCHAYKKKPPHADDPINKDWEYADFIEKSAYLTLQSELERCRGEVERLSNQFEGSLTWTEMTDKIAALTKERDEQIGNALKFTRERIVGYQASNNVFRVLDEEITKYDPEFKTWNSARLRRMKVDDRNSKIEQLIQLAKELRDALNTVECGSCDCGKKDCTAYVVPRALERADKILNAKDSE